VEIDALIARDTDDIEQKMRAQSRERDRTRNESITHYTSGVSRFDDDDTRNGASRPAHRLIM